MSSENADVLNETETTTEAPSTELTDERMDELANPKPTNRDVPMTKEEPKASTAQEKFLEFTHNGKPVKATIDQVIKWAQQGYDYPQKMGQFNQARQAFEAQRQQFEAQRQALEARLNPYVQVDQWAKANPDKWQAIQQAFQNGGQVNPQQAQFQPQPLDPRFNQLEQKLSGFEQFAQSLMQERQEAQNKAEDLKLDEEIHSIREAHKDLDWNSLDENGKSLEFRVLEHADKNGIKSFKTAFRDLYHDELLNRAQAQAKIAVSQGIQKNSKLGLLGTNQAPRKQGISEAKNIKKQSYEDLAREALSELKAVGA